MTTPAANLDRFLSAAHRRFVVARGLERVGVCLLVGCAAAAPLVGVLLSRGQPAMPVAAGIILLSVICGLVLAVTMAPKRVQTAMEADRQLRLADLLSSACLLEGAASSDPWQQSVLAMADARCRGLRASTVIFRRWGSRAWGGVGLAVALVLTLALFSSAPVPTQAQTGPLSIFAPRSSQEQTQPPNFDGGNSGIRQVRQVQSADPNAPVSDNTSDINPTATNNVANNTSASDRTDHAVTGNQASSGSGSSESNKHQLPASPRMQPLSNSAGPTAQPGLEHGIAGVGDGSTAGPSVAASDDRPSGTLGAAEPAGVAATAWSGSLAPADRQGAEDALQGGRIPDQYHDMVRDYFERR